MQYRDYQLEAIQSIWDYFAVKDGNPLVAMPTASGKSLVIAGFLQSVLHSYEHSRVMVLTHVKELIRQNLHRLLTVWPQAPAGVYSAGLKRRDYLHNIIFGGIASVARSPELFGWIDLVLIDEAHLVSPNDVTMYRRFLNALAAVNPKLKVIGFSATCYRLGLGALTEGGLFHDVCFDYTTLERYNRLVAMGWLCPLVPRRTAYQLDVSDVHTRGGEYVENELQAAVDRDEVTTRALNEVVQEASNRHRWLIFGTGIHHCERISAMLDERGVSNVVIHSKLPQDERDAHMAAFERGAVRCAVNNNILTTGIDVPAIDCIVVLRPTKSTVLWVQMLGRGGRCVYAPGHNLDSMEGRLAAMRAGPKQNCLVLDFAGNTARLGPINDPVLPKRPGKGGKGTAPVKLCPVCATYAHASARHCPQCGTEFPLAVRIDERSAGLEVMKVEAPIVELATVTHVTYHAHQRKDKPVSLRVSYYCGLRRFQEFVCFEHPGGARRRAEQWWLERAGSMVPVVPGTVAAVLKHADQLRTPRQLRVWTNKPYPEVMSYVF